ncbi:inositol monophosphatase [Patescibacteria group bacterium]|nr:inositol monophosphatase [Patescibacteria group bacterium]
MVETSYQKFITKVLESTSKIATDNFGKVSGTTKPEDNNQVLTETDIEIGNFITHEVQQTFPTHNIIDEEAGVIDKDSSYTWIIDPIDGTSNFAQGVPLYGIMIGLLKGDVPIAGGVALPEFSEVYIAEKGGGAYCNDERIRVSGETRLLSTLIAYSIDGHPEHPELTKEEGRLFGEIALRVRSLRASNSVFDIAMVAKGKYGATLHQNTKVWDNVAPHIILEEAGALYTDFWGKPMDYSNAMRRSKENYSICAAPPALHKQIQDIIHTQAKSGT